MTQIISRMFATRDQAAKACEELKQRSYQHVFQFSAPTEGAASTDDLVASMTKAFIPGSEARIYAEKIAKGSHLVSVHAPFSGGHRATWILDSYGPVDSGVPATASESSAWDSATPTSSALRMPLLSKTALPFEAWMGTPSLSAKPWTVSGCLGLPLLSKSPTPCSSALGMSTLSGNPTPLSSSLGLPLLK
jgi:hypothetical protein